MNPKYPYQVRVTYRVGLGSKRTQETRNFEYFDDMMAFRHKIMRKHGVTHVQTVMVLDEIKTGDINQTGGWNSGHFGDRSGSQ